MKKNNCLIMLTCIGLLPIFTSCSEKLEGEAVGAKYAEVFEESAKKEGVSTESIANDLAKCKASKYALTKNSVSGTRLVEFKKEIPQYTSAYKVGPKVNGIAFSILVFEVSEPSSYLESIDALANPAFEVCAYADYKKTAVEGDFVFYMMYTA